MTRGAAIAAGFALGLAACSMAVPAPQSRVAGSRCIDLQENVGRRVAAGGAVEFEMLGGRVYRNNLRGVCPGLANAGPAQTISIAAGGEAGQLCAGDRIRVADPSEERATGIANYPSCVLGDFMEVASTTH